MGDPAAAQVVRDGVVDDANLWKAVARAAVHHLPTIGSSVYYLPNRHRAAAADAVGGNAAPADHVPILKPGRIRAVVRNMELRARGEDVYVRYHLRTVDVANHGVGGGVLPGLDAGVIVRHKRLSPTDVDQRRYSCAISSDLATTLLPKPSPENFPGLKSADQYISLVGVHGNGFQLTRSYNFSSSTYRFGQGWSAFMDRHGLRSGDCLVFTKSNVAGVAWKLGMRRRSNGARVTPGEVDAAFEAATRGNGVDFAVDYYPGRMMQDEYVVLRRCMDYWLRVDNQQSIGAVVLYRSWNDSTHGTVATWRMCTIQNSFVDNSSPYFNIQTGRSRILHEGVRPWNLQPVQPLNHKAI